MKYQQNVKASDRFGKWLDEHFYNIPELNITGFTRILGECQQQYQGIDIRFVSGNTLIEADEKVSLEWVNLRTFTVEMRQTIGEERRDGWYLADYKRNTHYVFVFLQTEGNKPMPMWKAKQQPHKYTASIFLVTRQSLHELVNKHISDEEIRREDDRIVAGKKTIDRTNSPYSIAKDGMQYLYTAGNTHDTNSFSILFSRKELEEYAARSWTVNIN